MIAVIFEAEPRDGHQLTYLDIAARMRPLLDDIEGFVSVERFQSLANPGRSCRCRFSRTRALFPDGATSQRTGMRSAAAAMSCFPIIASGSHP